MSGEISKSALTNFLRKTKLKTHFMGLSGFLIGMKLADWVFYDHNALELLREDMEEEFWEQNGKPKFIKSHLVPSFKPGNEGKMRESYIAIVLDKDNRVKKLDELKEEILDEEDLDIEIK
jgi:hypothetical protein